MFFWIGIKIGIVEFFMVIYYFVMGGFIFKNIQMIDKMYYIIIVDIVVFGN